MERGLICLSNESKIVRKNHAGIKKQVSKTISVYANIREIKSFISCQRIDGMLRFWMRFEALQMPYQRN